MSNTMRAHKTSGFSLVEVILVVGVMAILVGLSAPPLFQFMNRRDIQTEENTMNEILKAVKLYAADRNTLPADSSTTWADELARYTSIASQKISKDTWGNPRVYVRHMVTDTFLGSSVNVFYVTLHSAGPDRKAAGAAATAGGAPLANGAGGIGVNGDAFAALTATTWWKNKADDTTRVDSFVAAQPASDDLMVRYTDYSDKIEKYNKSLHRLQAISQALESYATAKYNETVVACMGVTCNPTPENLSYYPPSFNESYTGQSSSVIAATTLADLNVYTGSNYIYVGQMTNHTIRRIRMVELMRILGLPDEYCCNALQNISGTKLEMPFYYYSNPLPRTPTGCGTTRLTPANALPARITVEGVEDNSNVCG